MIGNENDERLSMHVVKLNFIYVSMCYSNTMLCPATNAFYYTVYFGHNDRNDVSSISIFVCFLHC